MIAFLGTGLLGSGFVRALLRNGKQVQVWNRTELKAKVLESAGARCFKTPGEAVKGARLVHLALADDRSVDDVLEKIGPFLTPGVILADHTTTTSDGATKRALKWNINGIRYIHAPVFMGPQNALNSTGTMLVSGDREAVNAVGADLRAMTGKLVDLGPDPGRAAGIKLLGNSFLITMTAGIADMLALAKGLGIPSGEVASLFEWFNPGAMAPSRINSILKADFDNPSWELKMARKDVRLMMEEAQKGNTVLNVLPAIALEMDRWIGKGMGEKDWTIIAGYG